MFDAALLVDAAAAAAQADTDLSGPTEQDPAQDPASAATAAAAPEAADPAAAATATRPQATEWVFVDATLPELGQLLARVPAGAELVLLDPARDGLAQINAALAGQHEVKTVHLITHGDQGAVMLGSTRLDMATATEEHAAALATLGGHLASGADLLIYGCNVAGSAAAAQGMEALALALQADIGASDDSTGAPELGGDWTLERHTGGIEATALDGGGWFGTLAVLNVGISLNVNTPLSVAEDSQLAFTGSQLLQISLSNMLATSTEVQLSVQHGTLSFAAIAGVSITQGDGTQDTAVTLRGSAAAINQVLTGLSYNADPDYHGSDTLLLSIQQTVLGLVSIATPIGLGLLITPVADIVADSASTVSPVPVAINLMANDHFEGSTAVVSGVTQPAHGSVVVVGQVATYTPAPGYSGSDSFSYTVSSGTTTETATVALTVTLPNAPPTVSAPSSASGGEDQPLVFSSALGNALTVADTDGGVLTATLTVSHGSLSLAATAGLSFITGDGLADSTLVFSGTPAAINQALDGLSFTPDADYNGSAVLSISASDGLASHNLGVPITLAAVADAVNDSVVTDVLMPVTVFPLANDHFDASATVTAATGAAHGTLVLGLGGAVVYTPDPGYRGADSFIVTVSAGGVTETQTVAVTVGINHAPVVSGSLGSVSTQDGALLTLSVAAGFSDGDLGDTLSFSAVGMPTGLSIHAVSGLISGQLSGQASQGSGGVYSVQVTATDSGGLSATATLTVTVSNPGPLVAAAVAVGQEDSPLRIEALLNASDPDGDNLSIAAASALNGTVTLNPDGSLSYTPHANYNGVDSITYTVHDADGASATGTIAVTVLAVADLPTLQLPTIPLFTEDTPLIFASLLGTQLAIGDVDGQVLEIELSVPGGLLTLQQSAGVNISAGDGVSDSLIRMSGTAANLQAALELMQLLPGADHNGPLSLTVSLGELGQALGVTAVLPLGVVAVADIVDDQVSTLAGQPVAFNVLANDSFEHAGRTVTSFQTPAHGSLVLNAQGQAVYTPVAGFIGTDSFTYTVTSNGSTETGTITVSIAAAPNQGPSAVAMPDVQRFDGVAVSLNISASFSDADGDSLSFSATGLPTGLSIDAASGVISGTLGSAASSGSIGGVYTVTVSASDGRGGSVSQAFTLTVANPGPTASGDAFSTTEDTSLSGNVLTNDSDADGDALLVDTTPVVGPANGTLVINTDGSFSYTPDANFSGADSFSYRVTDADGSSSVATVALTVSPVNDAPTTAAALADRTATASTALSFNAGAGFADPEGDVLVFSATGLPPGLTIDPASGLIAGTPSTTGSFAVTVSAADGNGGSASLSFVFTISAAPNNGPTVAATLPTAAAADGAAVSLSTAGGFADADGDALSYSATGLPAGLSIDTATGLISGTLGSAASSGTAAGVYTVTVSVSDGRGGSVSQAFTLTVANPGPTASGDAFSTTEDTSLSGNVLTNDSDADGDALLVDTVPVVAPANGTLALNADGSFTYTPDANFSGTDSFSYRVTDADGSSSIATVSLTVNPVNDAPTAAAPLADRTATAGTALSFNAGAGFADPEGDVLAFSATGLPPGLTLDPATGLIAGTPSTTGSFAVTVSAADGNGGSASLSFVFTINAAPNNGPTVAATLPTAAAADGAAVALATSAGFTDADGDTLLFSATGLPVGLSIDATTGLISGTLGSAASSGSVGGVYTVTVSASDGRGGSVSQAFTLTVANPGPTASGDAFSTAEDTAVSGHVLVNDSDADGDALLVDTTPVVAPANGTLVLNADGSFTYTPDANFSGTDSFSYRVTDADGSSSIATVSLTVSPVNDAPTTSTALADRIATAGTALSFNAGAGFADPEGDVLAFSATGLPPGLTIDPATGLIAGTPSTTGSFAVTVSAADGNGGSTSLSFVFTISAAPNNGPTVAATLPTAAAADGAAVSLSTAGGFADADGDALSFSATGLPAGLSIDAATGLISGTLGAGASSGSVGGVYTVTVSASDGRGGSVSQAFTLTVANPGPTAGGDAFSMAEDTSLSGNVLTNDSDADGDALLVDTVPVVAPANGTLVLNADGSFTYTPDANFSGTDSFSYRVTDADGSSSVATVTLTVSSVNDAPAAAVPLADRIATAGTALSFNAGAGFADPEGDVLGFSATGLPPGLTIDPATGVIAGTPSTTGSFAVTVSATDGNGGSTSLSFVFTINAAPNNGPTVAAVLPTASAADGAAFSLGTAGGFADAESDALSFSATGLPAGLSIDAATGLISGTLGSAASSGTAGGVYTVTVSVSDGRGGSVSQAFTLTVANPGPTAGGDAFSTTEDTSLSGNVLTNDSDADGDALLVDTVPVVAPASGTLVLNADGSFTYTPDANFSGTDSFSYRVTDADGSSSVATVALTVSPVNDAPTAAVPLADRTATAGTALSFNAGAGFADPDGDVLGFSATGLPPGLTLDPATGVIAGTPSTTGSFAVTVSAADGNGGSTSASLVFTINAAPNNAPTAGADAFSTAEDTSLSGNVLTNDSDADGDALLVDTTPVLAPANGTLLLNADGSFTYTPDSDFFGTDSFSYRVTDARGSSSVTTASLTVNPLNPLNPVNSAAPVNDSPAGTVAEGQVGAANTFDSANRPGETVPSESDSGFGTTDLDPVLLQAINAVKSLGGVTDLSNDASLTDVIGAERALGGASEIDVNARPIETAVGDLNAAFRDPLRVSWSVDGNTGPLSAATASLLAGAAGASDASPQALSPNNDSPSAGAGEQRSPTDAAASTVQTQLLAVLQARQTEAEQLRVALTQF